MARYRRIGWWYWFVTAGLLAAGLSGWPLGFVLAMDLTVIQVVHYAWREAGMTAFPVQVRVAYLGLLMLGQLGPFHFLYSIALVGTSARVFFDYCALARILSLLPWNRHEPFSLSLLRRTFLSRPVDGNVLQVLGAARVPAREFPFKDNR